MESQLKTYKNRLSCILPVTRDNLCPICGTTPQDNIAVNAIHYDRNLLSYERSIDAMYCSKCRLPLLSVEHIEMQNQKRLTFKPILLRYYNGMSAQDALFAMEHKADGSNDIPMFYNSSGRLIQICNYIVTAKEGRDFSKNPKTLNAIPTGIEHCPNCYLKTHSSDHIFKNKPLYLPIDEVNAMRIKTKFCAECNESFFSQNSADKLNLIFNSLGIDNPVLKTSEFDKDFQSCLDLYKSDSSYTEIFLFEKHHSDECLCQIVSTRNAIRPPHVISIHNESTRKLLATVHHDNNYKNIKFATDHYRLKFWQTKADAISHFPPTVYIGKGGGLHNTDSKIEIITALVYSSVTSNYEMLNISYHKEKDLYFVDYHLYKKHVEKYGSLDTAGYYHTGKRTGHYNNESVLHEFGYNVGQQDDLLSEERHNILSDIIDLEILSPGEIISHLSWLIESRYDAKYIIARQKWREDINFVELYRVNPERFTTAHLSDKRIGI